MLPLSNLATLDGSSLVDDHRPEKCGRLLQRLPRLMHSEHRFLGNLLTNRPGTGDQMCQRTRSTDVGAIELLVAGFAPTDSVIPRSDHNMVSHSSRGRLHMAPKKSSELHAIIDRYDTERPRREPHMVTHRPLGLSRPVRHDSGALRPLDIAITEGGRRRTGSLCRDCTPCRGLHPDRYACHEGDIDPGRNTNSRPRRPLSMVRSFRSRRCRVSIGRSRSRSRRR